MSRYRWLIGLGVGFSALALLWKLAPIEEWLPGWLAWFQALGVLGIAAYLIAYLALASISFPTTPLAIGAGLLFDFWLALPVAIVGSFGASMISFYFGRSVGRDWVKRRMARLPRFERFVEAIDRDGFKMIVLVRLNPFLPASLKNYGFALTSVPWTTYALGTVLGQLPVVTAHVYLGWAGGAALLRGDQPPSQLEVALLVVGALVSVALVVVLALIAKKSSRRHGALAPP